MISIAAEHLIITVVGMAATGVLGFLVAQVKHLTKYQKARLIIDKASAREHIKTAYEKYVVDGKKMSISAYDDLLEEYEAYKILGGNGTGERYMAEIKALKPYLITD
jgi:F420-0:gamma-glutamyl ligase-like protein